MRVSQTSRVGVRIYEIIFLGYSNPRSSLILPANAIWVGSGGGLHNVAMNWSDIETTKLMIRHTPSRAFTPTDYLTVSLYDFGGSGGGNQWFRLAARDNTKYYFTDTAPVAIPPTSPQDPRVDGYDNSWRKSAIVSWNPASRDPDGMDSEITYELNRATSTAERFPDDTWKRVGAIDTGDGSGRKYNYMNATSGTPFMFGVRAVDEFGYASTVATTAVWEL